MAGKRLNKKLVIVLTLTVFAGMVALSMVMLGQLQRRDPKHFVELAEQARAESQWEHAAILYKKAWERSRDARHLVELGEVLLSNGDVRNALASWHQALLSEPDLMEAHRRRLELLLDLARLSGRIPDWQRVQEAAENILDIEADQSDADLAFAHHANGLALINLPTQDPSYAQRGKTELEQAAELAPESVDYPLELATLYFKEDDTQKAELIIQELLDRHRDPGAQAAKVRTAYAHHLAFRRLPDDARSYFQEGVALAEGDGEALREAQLAYANFLRQQWARAVGDEAQEDEARALFSQAEQILKKCVEADPNTYDPYLHLASLYKSSGRHGDVLEVCEQRLQRGLARKGVNAPRNRMSTFSLMIYASDACISQAIAAEQEGDSNDRDKWLVRARQYVVDAEGESPNHPRVLSQAGRVKVARGELRDALKDLRGAEEAYRSFSAVNWENVVVLARVHLRLNEPGAAREALEQALEEAGQRRPAAPSFWTLYGQTLLQTNEFDRALAVADRVLQIDPKNAEARRLKAAIYERQGKRAVAGRLIEELTGDRVIRAILTARESSLDGDAEAAISLLQTALLKDPAEPRLVGALARELTNLGRQQQARRIINDALAQIPDNVHLRRLAVSVREDLSEAQRASATLELIETETDGYKRSLDLVSFYLSKRDTPKTLEFIEEALGHLVNKDTPLARSATPAQHRVLLRAKIHGAAQLDDAAALEAAREEAVRFNVDGVGGKTVLGLYNMARKEYELAIGAFREALAVQPTDAWSLTHMAQCLQALDRSEEAQNAYERAIHINPDQPIAHKGLAHLAKTRGDDQAYQGHLEICQRLIPNDPWVRAELLARKELADPEAAIARREALAFENPEDLQNLQRLAALSETVGDLVKADDFYDRIVKLRPDDRHTVVAVTQYYSRTNRPERALDMLTGFGDARPTVVERANARILVAGHHLRQGHTDRAEQTLRAAVELTETPELARSLAEFYWKSVDDPRKALAWFDKAVELAQRVQSPLLPRILEARVACLLDGRINDTASAQRDVAQLLERFRDESRAYLLSSEIHARMGRIDEAIAALSEHLAKEPNHPYALFQRAKHQARRGRLAPAIQDLETIKRATPLALRLEPRILLASLYHRSDRKDLWIHELESLAKESPDAPTVLEELVNAYLREHRPQDADRIVTAQINRTTDNPNAQWFFLRGKVSLELNDLDKALADFHRAARLEEFSAASVTKVLDLYLQIGRFADGVTYFERYGGQRRNDLAPLSRYGALLGRSGRTAQAVEQLHKAIAVALADEPESASVIASTLPLAFAEPNDIAQAITLLKARRAEEVSRRAQDRLLAQLYQLAGLLDDAASTLDTLIQSAANDRERAALLQELGDVHQRARHWDRARAAYEEALKYDPVNWVVLNNLAYLLASEPGHGEQALPYARQAAALSDNPAALDTLGWTYVGLGRYPAAIAELNRSLNLAPGAALTMYHLGEAYRLDGQFIEAVGVLQNAQTTAGTQGDTGLQRLIEESLARAERGDAAP